MVTITMVHAPKRCPKCERTEEICRQVAAEFPGQVRVELLGAQQASARYGVVLTPTVIVDDMLVSSGAIPRKAKIREAVAQRIEACALQAAQLPHSSAFAHGKALVEGDLVYVCADEFVLDEKDCQPMLLFWHIEEGQDVEKGQELAEVESAKAVFVIESPVAGTIQEILVHEGETVHSQQRLASIKPRSPVAEL